LEQGVGVKGRHHDVVLAVHDEHRLGNLLQPPCSAGIAVSPPGDDRSELSTDGLL
jgi:hypothetical protein